MAAAQEGVLKFQQLQSAVDPAFWADFARLKLNELRLSEAAVPIRGYLSASNSAEVAAPLQLDGSSLGPAAPSTSARAAVPGELLNFNTIESLRCVDHAAALAAAAARVWGDILSGAAEQRPELLCRFLLLSHADLKTYRYHYWFAFPALKPPRPLTAAAPATLLEAVGVERSSQVVAAVSEWLATQRPPPPFWLLESLEAPACCPLAARDQLRGEGTVLVASDPGNSPGHPGWPLRNLLLLAAVRWRLRTASVLCLRSQGGRPSAERSLLLRVTLPEALPGLVPAAVGWEPGARGRPGTRLADLGAAADPARLAAAAAELNVRLMKWRAAPGLDADRLAATRCLLLGAGTLGCAVARTLLGWGVRDLTLLDAGRVAFSNPVRQSLYEFADCGGGGAPKAAAAAARLRSVFPAVRAEGVQLSIPMPGHPFSEADSAQVAAAAARLDALVRAHDVVFLLTDTRESRWLPTLLCAAHGRLAVNAALGFDSFLVMRHGAWPQGPEDAAAPPRLGCYFCNDVVAPLKSTADRTLDQQCTVARPGLAPIAGALAVELMAAVLQHPAGAAAPATADGAALGAAPHMVRGQLGSFSQACLTGQAFRQCTACSPTVVRRYRQSGWAWLRRVLQAPRLLEDETGLTELLARARLGDAELESLSDGGQDGSEDGFVSL